MLKKGDAVRYKLLDADILSNYFGKNGVIYHNKRTVGIVTISNEQITDIDFPYQKQYPASTKYLEKAIKPIIIIR